MAAASRLAFGNFTEEDAKIVLRVANYSNMQLFSSRIVMRLGDAWESEETWDAVYSIGFGDLVCKVTKNLTGPAFTVTAAAGGFRIRTGNGVKSPMEQVDAHFFSAEASTSYSSFHYETKIGLTLVECHVSALDVRLGVGLSCGAGIKDDSLTLKVAGTGFQLGRKIGVSVLGNSVAVDLGKCSVM